MNSDQTYEQATFNALGRAVDEFVSAQIPFMVDEARDEFLSATEKGEAQLMLSINTEPYAVVFYLSYHDRRPNHIKQIHMVMGVGDAE